MVMILTLKALACPRRRISAGSEQRLSFEETFILVESKDTRCDLADWGQGNDGYAVRIQLEVLPPRVCSRIEKADQLARLGHDRSDVAPLVPVADEAGIGEVVLMRPPTMLFADDVVDLTAEKRIVGMNETIFAERICT